MTEDRRRTDPARQGALQPTAEPGKVIVHNPPSAPMHMTAEEADISGIRLLDAADKARKAPGETPSED
jgi:hypothetical protein